MEEEEEEVEEEKEEGVDLLTNSQRAPELGFFLQGGRQGETSLLTSPPPCHSFQTSAAALLGWALLNATVKWWQVQAKG